MLWKPSPISFAPHDDDDDDRCWWKGEAKAAEERKAFVRRDVEQAEALLREAETSASEFDRESVDLREKYPELWGA